MVSTKSQTAEAAAFSSFRRRIPRSMALVLVLLALHISCISATLGGEKAFFQTEQMTPNITHRQNVCDRYDLFRNQTVELRDALEGLELHLGMASYPEAYFNYDPINGINQDYPGLAAVILDEIARRGKFTWRDSFGVTTIPADTNSTWKDLLLWSIDTYDVHIDWWSQDLDRMNWGVAFLKEWYDSSIILISKEAPTEVSNEINYWNWLRPYDTRVWAMTLFTIFFSGVVYQILEYFAGDRQERSMWVWWQENFYLSAINATQAYEYEPKSLASRIFGISMASWALVMTATYTANLASLLVDRKPPPVVAQNIDEVAVFGNKICTWEGTHNDNFIKTYHPGATRIPKKTILEVYQGLHKGECEFAAEAVASWNKLKAMQEYNPLCDLYWVGGDRKALDVKAGFVSKIDSGRLCTGFIRDVINFHIHQMIEDGFLATAWDREFERTASLNCDTFRPELAAVLEEQLHSDDIAIQGKNLGTRRHLLRSNMHDSHSGGQRRQLRRAAASAAAGGAVAAAAAAGDGMDATELTLEQMLGTFAFHYILMLIALGIATFNAVFDKTAKPHAKKVTKQVRNSIVSRTNSFLSKSTFLSRSNLMGSSTRRAMDIASRLDEESYDKINTSGGLGISNGSRRTEETSCREQEEEISGVTFASDVTCMVKSHKDMQQQMTNMRRSQALMRRSQTKMEQAQLEMLIEQRQLQAQIQVLLAAHGPSVLEPLRGQRPEPVAVGTVVDFQQAAQPQQKPKPQKPQEELKPRTLASAIPQQLKQLAPKQKIATFLNTGKDPAMAKAELYYKATRWGSLGHQDPPISVSTYPGDQWYIVANGVYAKLFTVGDGAQQEFTI